MLIGDMIGEAGVERVRKMAEGRGLSLKWKCSDLGLSDKDAD